MPEDHSNTRVEHLPYANELTTRLPYAESELRVRIGEAIGAASMCWSDVRTAGTFESERAAAVADDLVANVLRLTRLGEPHLGCATTRELQQELTTRARLTHPGLDYRPVDAD